LQWKAFDKRVVFLLFLKSDQRKLFKDIEKPIVLKNLQWKAGLATRLRQAQSDINKE
jgi:hypothetical protein